MDGADKETIIKRYNMRLAKYGDDIRTLASGTEERREVRFRILSEVGFDINPQLVEIARKKYPRAKFVVRDIQIESFSTFDFVVSSSAFNLRLNVQDNYEFIEEILRTCFFHSTHGVAFDFLSSYVDHESPHAFHYDPERVFSIAKKITKRVCLRHDYPLYEFCMYLYPDFAGWRPKHACAAGMHNF
jgi:hypothetical protein